MYDFNPLNRIIDVDALLNEYENILLEIGVLTRLKKSFQNNILVNKPPAPPAIMEQSKKDEKSESNSKSKSKSKSKHLSAELQELANKDATEISNEIATELVIRCSEGKELNPKTNRCNNECKPGFSRDSNFKCHSKKKRTRKLSSNSKSSRSSSSKNRSKKSK
jgi:hypothetical protein